MTLNMPAPITAPEDRRGDVRREGQQDEDQYSERRARPLNPAYWENTLRTASAKLMNLQGTPGHSFTGTGPREGDRMGGRGDERTGIAAGPGGGATTGHA